MIKAAVLALLSGTFILSKIQVKPGYPQHTCSDILGSFNKCWQFEHCLYYQVTQQYTNYGCGICNDYYELQEDANGTGYCLYNPNAVKHCRWPSKRVDGTHFCYLCEEKYILSPDATSCDPRPDTSSIPYCLSYAAGSKGTLCSMCYPNYTTSDHFTKCVPGCSFENCQDCANSNGVSQCLACKPGTIGVWNPTTFTFDACLTCDAYQCELLTAEAKDCCLNQLSHC